MEKREIIYTIDKASQDEILNHLLECDNEFIPPLHQKVNIADYSNKIFSKAIRFEAWLNNKMIGLVAGYFNNPTDRIAFITNVSITPDCLGNGIGKRLLDNCIAYGLKNQFIEIRLEVNESNHKAVNLYNKLGFEMRSKKNDLIQMKKGID